MPKTKHLSRKAALRPKLHSSKQEGRWSCCCDMMLSIALKFHTIKHWVSWSVGGWFECKHNSTALSCDICDDLILQRHMQSPASSVMSILCPCTVLSCFIIMLHQSKTKPTKCTRSNRLIAVARQQKLQESSGKKLNLTTSKINKQLLVIQWYGQACCKLFDFTVTSVIYYLLEVWDAQLLELVPYLMQALQMQIKAWSQNLTPNFSSHTFCCAGGSCCQFTSLHQQHLLV